MCKLCSMTNIILANPFFEVGIYENELLLKYQLGLKPILTKLIWLVFRDFLNIYSDFYSRSQCFVHLQMTRNHVLLAVICSLYFFCTSFGFEIKHFSGETISSMNKRILNRDVRLQSR